MKRIIFLFLAACAFGVRAEESLILWMVESTTAITLGDGSTSILLPDLLERQGYSSYADSFGARVHATGMVSDQAVDGYLCFIPESFVDGTGNTVPNDTVWLPNGDSPPQWTTGKQYAGVSAYAGADASVSFMIELGFWNEKDDWVVLAVSQAAGYNELKEKWHVSPGVTTDPRYVAWTGGAFVVPEPSSGLLLLVGAGLLSLRRRRRARAS